MKTDHLAEGMALDPAVQDLLLAAADHGHVRVSTSAVALVHALAVRPGVVRVDGTLTRFGQRIATAMADAGMTKSGALPEVGEQR